MTRGERLKAMHEVKAGEDPGFVLLVDKPYRWTSFDVVNKVRRLLGVKKVGHAGTLDPLATGLLILCTGKKTKTIDQFVSEEKEYEASILLGASTASYDGDTPIQRIGTTEQMTREDILSALLSFVGRQKQFPPMHSAVKVGGKRLYKFARRGKEVERRARSIVVSRIMPVLISPPAVCATIVCSKGTYVRSLAYDFGNLLGCGAFLSQLRRTRIGQYSVSDALSFKDIAVMANDASQHAV